jgi:F-type H+-transporting ATPase subunit b
MAEDPVAHNLSQAAHGKGMALPSESGAHALTTEEGAHHPEPASFGIVDATVWVSIAMAAFIAILLWKKVPGLITRGLDNQIAAIKARLDEAKALRAEAEALRDEYARKIASVEAQAAGMVAHADEEAKALIAKAKVDADELVKRRGKMAEDKIAAAERAALDQVRARAADAAAKAAATIIAQKHDAGADKALVDGTIAGLSRLN